MRVVVLFLLATLVPLLPFLVWLARRRSRTTRADVADGLEAFLDGTGRPRDWKRFLSARLDDAGLDAIRERCRRLPEEYPPEQPGEYCSDAGRQVLRSLVRQLRNGSAADRP